MAALKTNDLEMIGSDLSASAHVISDLVSPVTGIMDQAYLAKANVEELTHEGPWLANQVSADCRHPVSNSVYKFKFSGQIIQDGIEMEAWNAAQHTNFANDEDWLLHNCNFATVDGRRVVPFIEPLGDNEVIPVRYQDALDSVVWDESTWYVAPEQTSSHKWQDALKDTTFASAVKESKETCAAAVPFFGSTLHTNYANTISSGSFMGLQDSAMFCNSPFSVNFFYDRPSGDPEYVCPESALPHSFPGWDPKWFSPVCRPWFKFQK